MPEIERRGPIFTQKQTIDSFQRESAQLRTALRVFTEDNIRLDHQIGDQAIYEDVVEGDISQLMECLSDGGDSNSSLSGMNVHEGESDGGFANGKHMDEDVSGLIQGSLKTVYRCVWEITERACQHCGEEYRNHIELYTTQTYEEAPEGLKMDESDATFPLDLLA
ncbi:hypothetical protein V5O48_004405 [Marasmius crinis-equi]|uniref:Uncharacterized protein n=1 Tax=Marasmius crinis-equi TaxID=585013 RepID=A0ABR3FQD0_9AGAR